MSDLFAKMEYNKKSLLSLFVQLAKADHRIDDNEVAFINEVREKLGVPAETLEAIWENDDQYPLDPPKSEKHRLTIFQQLLLLMNIDGDVAAEEEDFVRNVGTHLSINPKLIDELIKTAREHQGEHLSIDAIIDTMQRFMA